MVRTRVAEVGEGGDHLEFKLTTHSIDYAVHSTHAVGTWCFEGDNLRAGREISKGGTSHVLKIMINNSNIRIRRAIVTEEPVMEVK